MVKTDFPADVPKGLQLLFGIFLFPIARHLPNQLHSRLAVGPQPRKPLDGIDNIIHQLHKGDHHAGSNLPLNAQIGAIEKHHHLYSEGSQKGHHIHQLPRPPSAALALLQLQILLIVEGGCLALGLKALDDALTAEQILHQRNKAGIFLTDLFLLFGHGFPEGQRKQNQHHGKQQHRYSQTPVIIHHHSQRSRGLQQKRGDLKIGQQVAPLDGAHVIGQRRDIISCIFFPEGRDALFCYSFKGLVSIPQNGLSHEAVFEMSVQHPYPGYDPQEYDGLNRLAQQRFHIASHGKLQKLLQQVRDHYLHPSVGQRGQHCHTKIKFVFVIEFPCVLFYAALFCLWACRALCCPPARCQSFSCRR